MLIKAIEVGYLQTNCYVVADEATLDAAVIDPGADSNLILDYIERCHFHVRAILLTHGHFDHCTGVAGMLERHPELPVYICEKDVTDGVGSEMQFARLPEKNQRYYKDGDTLTLGALTISVLETPGHTPGSVCLLVGDVMFAGDTLFRGSCGRTDFPGGDYRAMLRSLGRLGKLEGNYQVYPGHEQPTNLDFERRFNPYMQQGMAQ